jgi:ATP-dependent RNA helicase DDX24/MAK5
MELCARRSDDEVSRTSKKKSKRVQFAIDQLKAQLDDELRQPLTVRGISSKYITSSNQAGLVDRLLNQKGHDAVIGLKRSSAIDDLRKPSKRSKKSAN